MPDNNDSASKGSLRPQIKLPSDYYQDRSPQDSLHERQIPGRKIEPLQIQIPIDSQANPTSAQSSPAFAPQSQAPMNGGQTRPNHASQSQSPNYSDYNHGYAQNPQSAPAQPPARSLNSDGASAPNSKKKISKEAIAFAALFAFIFIIIIAGILFPGIIFENPAARTIEATATAIAQNATGTRACSKTIEHGDCAPVQPLYCQNGALIKRADICGCPQNLRAYNGSCIPIINCPDGTLSPDCSQNKPYQCINGVLQQNAQLCGCDGDLLPNGDVCISLYEVDPLPQAYSYILDGENFSIEYTAYGGINRYLANQSRIYTCPNNICPTQAQMRMFLMDEPNQKPYISSLARQIESAAPDKGNQARIAASMVQRLRYDSAAFDAKQSKKRYPYQVLYDKEGLCEEKSMLMASILRELGFGVALLQFDAEQHMAVGIKCAPQYAYKKTGYCFIEATAPSIISDGSGNYVGAGGLSTQPSYIVISDGLEFDASQDFADAARYRELLSGGPRLKEDDYNEAKAIERKYGLLLN